MPDTVLCLLRARYGSMNTDKPYSQSQKDFVCVVKSSSHRLHIGTGTTLNMNLVLEILVLHLITSGFCGMAPVGGYRSFGGTSCLHLWH